MELLFTILKISFICVVLLRVSVTQFGLYNQLILCTSAMHLSTKAPSKERNAMRLTKDSVSVMLTAENGYGLLLSDANCTFHVLGFK